MVSKVDIKTTIQAREWKAVSGPEKVGSIRVCKDNADDVHFTVATSKPSGELKDIPVSLVIDKESGAHNKTKPQGELIYAYSLSENEIVWSPGV